MYQRRKPAPRRKKPPTRPKTKHKEFALTMYRTVGDDWLIIVWCEANRQACYFLAEPEYQKGTGKVLVTGYWVSALDRQGESQSTITGLPRSFKDTMQAGEWLAERVYRYKGDTFVDPSVQPAQSVQVAP